MAGQHSQVTRLGYTLSRRVPLLEAAKSTLLIFSALFPIVNPLGGSPVFLALTRDYPTSARRILARHVATNSFVLLIASFLIGSHILEFFGISIPVVQVGGGLIVISNGWAMLKSKEETDRGPAVQKKVNMEDISRSAFYPGRQRTASPRPESYSRSRRFDRLGAFGREHLSLLWLRPSLSRHRWRKRDEHYPAALFFPSRLHRRANSLEWCKGLASFPACRRGLILRGGDYK